MPDYNASEARARGIVVFKSLKDDTYKYDPGTARAIRQHLERIAYKIEHEIANRTYMHAYRRIARLIRESKPD
jgi:hypothetical protein